MSTATIHETAEVQTVVWRGMSEQFRNHFATRNTDGALDLAEVRDGLFGWDVVASESVVANILTPDGVTQVPLDRKALVRSDTLRPIGEHSTRYGIHQPREWLIDAVGDILDAETVLAGAGHFRYGAINWVQAELPDTIVTKHGIGLRPSLTAATSHDGSCATTYTLAGTVIVCSNTFAAAMSENPAQRIRYRHTANSVANLADIRGALNILHGMGAELTAELDALCEQVITDRQFDKIIKAAIGDPLLIPQGRSRTMMQTKVDTLRGLWNDDPMVAPWKRTKWGAMQAFSTFRHHHQNVRGTDRVTRNMERAVLGGNDVEDAKILALLARV